MLLWALYIALPILALVMNAVLAVWVYRNRRDAQGSLWFVVSLLAGALWMGLFAAALLSTDRSLQTFLFVLSDKAMVTAIGCWLVFASLYSRAGFHRHPMGVAGFLVLAGSVAVPTFVDPFFSAWYGDPVAYTDPVHYVYLEPKLPVLLVAVALGALTIAGVGSLTAYLAGTPRESGTKIVLLVTATMTIPLALALGIADLLPAVRLNHAAYGLLPFNLLTTIVRTMTKSHGWTVVLDEAADGTRFVVTTGVGGSVRATG